MPPLPVFRSVIFSLKSSRTWTDSGWMRVVDLERIETQVSSQEDSIANVRRLRRRAAVVFVGKHGANLRFTARIPCSIDENR